MPLTSPHLGLILLRPVTKPVPHFKPSEDKMKTKHDRLVSELCDEIDTLEAENEALTGKYEELSRKYSKLLDDTLKGCERTTGAIIGLTLAGKLKL